MANIKVSIAENDLKTLKTNKYNLCLAFGERSIDGGDARRIEHRLPEIESAGAGCHEICRPGVWV